MIKELQKEQETSKQQKEVKQVVAFPKEGLVRVSQIVGDKKQGVPPFIPISRSSWWAGVKSGRYPKPVKLSERCTCWHAEDIWLLAGEV